MKIYKVIKQNYQLMCLKVDKLCQKVSYQDKQSHHNKECKKSKIWKTQGLGHHRKCTQL